MSSEQFSRSGSSGGGSGGSDNRTRLSQGSQSASQLGQGARQTAAFDDIRRKQAKPFQNSAKRRSR
jgi:hypothetical protein